MLIWKQSAESKRFGWGGPLHYQWTLPMVHFSQRHAHFSQRHTLNKSLGSFFFFCFLVCFFTEKHWTKQQEQNACLTRKCIQRQGNWTELKSEISWGGMPPWIASISVCLGPLLTEVKGVTGAARTPTKATEAVHQLEPLVQDTSQGLSRKSLQGTNQLKHQEQLIN